MYAAAVYILLHFSLRNGWGTRAGNEWGGQLSLVWDSLTVLQPFPYTSLTCPYQVHREFFKAQLGRAGVSAVIGHASQVPHAAWGLAASPV